MSEDFFDELLTYVRSVTGLTGREAAHVAFEFAPEDGVPTPQAIIEVAERLGLDVERKHTEKPDTGPWGPDLEMDPASVLTHVYMECPRVMMTDTPRMGKAPTTHEMSAHLMSMLAELPEEVQAAIVNVNLSEGEATFWLHDEANQIDRKIGPIDITRYTSENALRDAMMDLLKRINKVLAADTN